MSEQAKCPVCGNDYDANDKCRACAQRRRAAPRKAAPAVPPEVMAAPAVVAPSPPTKTVQLAEAVDPDKVDVSQLECPICGYVGAFVEVRPTTGVRPHAQCPGCGSLERHRLQWLVLKRLSVAADFSAMRMLHIAPEPFLRERFKAMFASYTTADQKPAGVDYALDLTKPTPFAANSFDLIYASHVLEHIRDDAAALATIATLLAPGGTAILPVPIIAAETVEYPAANPAEADHVRAPGADYYQRYERHFRRVEVFKSTDFEARYQTYIHEDRSQWPPSMPLRPTMAGKRFADAVPVCTAWGERA